jgi:hypothetical protein
MIRINDPTSALPAATRSELLHASTAAVVVQHLDREHTVPTNLAGHSFLIRMRAIRIWF